MVLPLSVSRSPRPWVPRLSIDGLMESRSSTASASVLLATASTGWTAGAVGCPLPLRTPLAWSAWTNWQEPSQEQREPDAQHLGPPDNAERDAASPLAVPVS